MSVNVRSAFRNSYLVSRNGLRQFIQDLLGMALEFYIFPDLFDLPLGIDEDSRAQYAHKLLTVIFALPPAA